MPGELLFNLQAQCSFIFEVLFKKTKTKKPNKRTYICTDRHIYMLTHTYMYAHTHAHTHAHTQIYTHMHIHRHTHTSIYTGSY